MSRRPKRKVSTTCPACAGRGQVCCSTWAMVRAHADEDLSFNSLGMPLWPLLPSLEIPYCPFCRKTFKPITPRRGRSKNERS